MKVRGLSIKKIGAEIYYIRKDIVPIQLLVTLELPADDETQEHMKLYW
jgi:hypothetical protein